MSDLSRQVDSLRPVLALGLACLPALAVAPAQAAPPGFNVQGRLSDSNGVNRDGTFSLKFTAFDAPAGGSVLWVKTFGPVSVKNGNFQVTIEDPDDSAPAKKLIDAFAAASPHLEIQVLGGPGVTGPEPPLVPRQRLLSDPSAAPAKLLCPAGFTSVETAGRQLGCVQTSQQGRLVGQNAFVANQDCFRAFGGRLPTMMEWRIAFNNFALTYGSISDIELVGDFTRAGPNRNGMPAVPVASPDLITACEDIGVGYIYCPDVKYRCWIAK